MLGSRIQGLQQRVLIVVLSVTALVLAVLSLLLAVYAGVMHTVTRLREASEGVLGDGAGSPVLLDTHDEMGEVVLAFNRVAQRLRTEKLQADNESQRARAA